MANTERLAQLRENLVEYFILEELRTLCFDLGVDWDRLRGEEKEGKVTALLTLLDNTGRIPDLTERCARLRPNVLWTEILPPVPGLVKPVPDKPLRVFQVQMADRHAEEGQMPPSMKSFPAGTRQVFLAFRYGNMPLGQSLSVNVYDRTAKLVSEWSHRYEDVVPAGVSSCLLPAFADEFAPGDYRVEIRAGEQLVGEAHFAVQVTPARPLRVFLCHSSSDKPIVRTLYQRLRTNGFAPWLDEEDLLPGKKWQEEIPRAVRNSDVVIVCLSKGAVTKAGYVQKEIKYALDVADEQPEGAIFLIPLRLEECQVPDRLSQWQWVNYFDERGYERLLQALWKRAEDVEATVGEESAEGGMRQTGDVPASSELYQPTNLVVNPGFEDGFTGWAEDPAQFQYGSESKEETVEVHSGHRSRKLFLRHGGSHILQTIPVQLPANTGMILRAWVKMPYPGDQSNKWFTMELVAIGAEGHRDFAVACQQTEALPTWTQLSVGPLVTSFPVTQLDIHAKTTNGNGSYQGYDRPVWVDDFELDIALTAQPGISTRDVNMTFGGGNIITGAQQVIIH
jgi:hypothetical protein